MSQQLNLLSADLLRLLAPDLTERVVFCCGPAPYMAAVRRILDLAGSQLPVRRIVAGGVQPVGCLQQRAATDGVQLALSMRVRTDLEQPKVLLPAEDLERTLLVAGGDHAIGHFPLDDGSRRRVANAADGRA